MEGIEIIDVSNLTRPVRADQYKHTNGLATPMVIVNHYLYYYVPEGDYSSPTPRWHILDISSPQQIRFVGEVFDLYEPMAVSDHYILATRRVNNTAASLFQIIDVVDNTAPVALSEIRIESLWVYGIEVRDDLAYVSAGSGLRILDISDPYVPTMIRDDLTLIGSFAHMDMADNIIVGDFIFALEIELQGQSVDIVPLARLNIEKFMETFCGSDISLPNYSGEVKTVLCSVPSASFDQAPNDIAIANGYVYVASKRAGLLIFQIPQ